eukprot:1643628-Pleurochrysis_carterae.AAC.1
MLSVPHAVAILPQSEDSTFASCPPSSVSHARPRRTRRNTAAASAERTCTPRRNARQKYWFTRTACSSDAAGIAAASAYGHSHVAASLNVE